MPDLDSLPPTIIDWYLRHRRDLPWRRPGISGWEVLVSEVMLQQTPVVRVLPAYDAWLRRWPCPGALAVDSAGEAVRMWGRLGYPRRALRLHEAAVAIDERHDGRVPDEYDDLRALPGVGEYTAAAISAFAYRRRSLVLDTNVRRVLARVLGGEEHPPRHLTRAERDRAAGVLPDDGDTAATWSVAVMELGALVCTARAPSCADCPVRRSCRWRRAGSPAQVGPPRRAQTYAGTDRQCRGRILALLRDSDEPVPLGAIGPVWGDPRQRERALASLLADGLAVRTADGRIALP